jgi:hypothetical protein
MGSRLIPQHLMQFSVLFLLSFLILQWMKGSSKDFWTLLRNILKKALKRLACFALYICLFFCFKTSQLIFQYKYCDIKP